MGKQKQNKTMSQEIQKLAADAQRTSKFPVRMNRGPPKGTLSPPAFNGPAIQSYDAEPIVAKTSPANAKATAKATAPAKTKAKKASTESTKVSSGRGGKKNRRKSAVNEFNPSAPRDGAAGALSEVNSRSGAKRNTCGFDYEDYCAAVKRRGGIPCAPKDFDALCETGAGTFQHCVAITLAQDAKRNSALPIELPSGRNSEERVAAAPHGVDDAMVAPVRNYFDEIARQNELRWEHERRDDREHLLQDDRDRELELQCLRQQRKHRVPQFREEEDALRQAADEEAFNKLSDQSGLSSQNDVLHFDPNFDFDKDLDLSKLAPDSRKQTSKTILRAASPRVKKKKKKVINMVNQIQTTVYKICFFNMLN